MSIQQLSVFLENKPGSLEKFAKVLKDNNIDMISISIAVSLDFGILRVIVNDPYTATNVLRDAGYVIKITPVLGVELSDKPGAMLSILEALRLKSINIEYFYAFESKKKNTAYMIFRTENMSEAEKAVISTGADMLEQSDFDD